MRMRFFPLLSLALLVLLLFLLAAPRDAQSAEQLGIHSTSGEWTDTVIGEVRWVSHTLNDGVIEGL